MVDKATAAGAWPWGAAGSNAPCALLDGSWPPLAMGMGRRSASKVHAQRSALSIDIGLLSSFTIVHAHDSEKSAALRLSSGLLFKFLIK